MSVQRWPPRRPPSGTRRLPGLRTGAAPAGRAAAKDAAAERGGPASGPEQPAMKRPLLVPLARRDAFWSAVVIAAVIAFLAWFLYYLSTLWYPQEVPQQIVYLMILVLTVLAVLLFAWSLLGFVLPRLFGLRRAPAPPAGKD